MGFILYNVPTIVKKTMESINIADRDMLFWARSPNRFNDSNSNDFIVNEDVIVKYFKGVMTM